MRSRCFIKTRGNSAETGVAGGRGLVSEGKDPEVGRGLSCLRTGSEARPPGAQRVKVSLAQARSGDGGRGQACGVIARNLDFFF